VAAEKIDAETPTEVDTFVAHLVEVTEFLWTDSPANIPPICHTCPKYQNGGIPCIGILVLLSNLTPLVNETSVTSWQKGKGLMRPEIFKSRWRVDRDPTRFLEKYSPPAPPPPRRHLNQTGSAPEEALLTSDVSDKFELIMQRIGELVEVPKQAALRAINGLLQQMDRICGKHELDVLLAKTCQVLSLFL
jgi:hypothetical protein